MPFTSGQQSKIITIPISNFLTLWERAPWTIVYFNSLYFECFADADGWLIKGNTFLLPLSSSVMLEVAFRCQSLGPHFPLEKSLQVNTKFFWMMTFMLWWNGSTPVENVQICHTGSHVGMRAPSTEERFPHMWACHCCSLVDLYVDF